MTTDLTQFYQSNTDVKGTTPDLTRFYQRNPELKDIAADLMMTFEILRDSFRAGGKLLLCGNGGSAADCEHIVGELMKGFRKKRTLPEAVRAEINRADAQQGAYIAENLQGALPTISLISHTSLLSAFSNDVCADLAFAQQVYGYGKKGDVLLGISTSGKSKNVLYAFIVARALGLYTVGLTGPMDQVFRSHCDATISVPGCTTAQIQEQHLPVYHLLCALLEDAFF